MEGIETVKNTNDEIGELLKGHYDRRNNLDLVSVGNRINRVEKKNEGNLNENGKSEFFFKLKLKFGLQLIGALCLGLSVYAYKSFPDDLKNNKIFNVLKNEYSKSYSKEFLIEKAEDLAFSVYNKNSELIPESLYKSVSEKYLYSVKPKLLNFNLNNFNFSDGIDNSIAVFNLEEMPLNKDENMVIAEKATTTSSELSLMSMDVKAILDKKLNIILPVDGTVTSIYGAREEVFKNVGYHTGIDIANAYDTPIKSATEGVVTLAQEMDKYYGNNIEIETDGVIFKYAHLNKINVKVGDKVSQGQIIGLMGSTGASTGSHLHFEIMIGGRSVDPELIIKIR